MTTPHRPILIAVCGMTPQIVTETLYGIYKQDSSLFPAEIQLITTADGAAKASAALLADGHLQRFCSDYGLPAPLFGDAQIHVLRDATGSVLKDIRKPSENESMADFIVAHIQRLTADDETALHVSLAGGRKTMSYYIGYALSLFGRPQDRLSHVLVEDKYESSAEFWYPTPYPQAINGRDGTRIDARLADIHLAEIPFVRLRELMPASALLEQQSFSAVVRSLQLAWSERRIVVDVSSQSLLIGERRLKLGAADFAFYWWLARRVKNGEGGIAIPSSDEDYVTAYADAWLPLYRQLKGLDADETDRTIAGVKPSANSEICGLHKRFIEQRKTVIHRELSAAFGKIGVERYGFAIHKHNGAALHTLAAAADDIEIRE